MAVFSLPWAWVGFLTCVLWFVISWIPEGDCSQTSWVLSLRSPLGSGILFCEPSLPQFCQTLNITYPALWLKSGSIWVCSPCTAGGEFLQSRQVGWLWGPPCLLPISQGVPSFIACWPVSWKTLFNIYFWCFGCFMRKGKPSPWCSLLFVSRNFKSQQVAFFCG